MARGLAMDHKEAIDLADAYIDGELPPASRAEVDAHLVACADCRAVFDSRRTFITRLKTRSTYYKSRNIRSNS